MKLERDYVLNVESDSDCVLVQQTPEGDKDPIPGLCLTPGEVDWLIAALRLEKLNMELDNQ